MTKKLLPSSALFFTACLSLQAAQWNFSSGDQGWKVEDLAGNGTYSPTGVTSTPDYVASGGNPGGFIRATDPSSNTFFFKAPTADLGDFSSYVGGMLAFSLYVDLSPSWTVDNVVILRGVGLTLIGSFSTPAAGQWNNYSIGLNAANFRYNNQGGATVSSQDFNQVLGNLGDFLINAEYYNGVVETTSLDSVSFKAPSVSVPDALPFWALPASLGALLFVRSRRRA